MDNLKINLHRLLRWSEKYVKTDMLYLAKGGFWLNSKQLIISLSSFAIAISFANLLSKEDFGIYKYIQSIVLLLTIFSLDGMSSSIIQSVARGLEGSFISAVKTRIKFGFMGAIICLGMAGYYFFQNNYNLAIGLTMSAVFIPFFESLISYNSLLVGRKDFYNSAKFQIISQIISAISIISSLLLTHNIFIILFVYFLSHTVTRGCVLLWIIKKNSPNKNTDQDSISYGKHLSLINITGLIAKHIDKIIVFHFLGTVDLAIYAFAITPPNQISGLLGNIETLALPKYSNGNEQKIKSSIIKKMLFLAFTILMIVIFYIIASPFVYDILFPQYIDAIKYSQVYAISLIAATATLPLAFIQGHKKIESLYKFNIVSPVINIIVLLISIQFGLMGIIIGRVANRFLNLFFLTYLAKK